MLTDLSLSELRQYRPDVEEPADFDEFWATELAAARAQDTRPSFAPLRVPEDTHLRHAEVFDVSFPGYGGEPVRGWLLVPRELAPSPKLIVEFIGYGGGRGNPLDWLTWSSAGYPHLIMDTRGQGGGWRGSDTSDPSDNGAPSTRGFMTRGIADPRTHYYTRLLIDAARATDAARHHPVVGSLPLVTTGRSQGGGLSIAAAHLGVDVAAAMPDVPFLAHFRRAADVTRAHPYEELAEYCRVHSDQVDRVFTTLSYIDVVNHARRVSLPALFSVGLSDEITPPSTVFTAFNHYAGNAKDIAVYPFNGHEGGGTRHFLAQLEFVAGLAGGGGPGPVQVS
jgi:cephalosporin-C deacetylase